MPRHIPDDTSWLDTFEARADGPILVAQDDRVVVMDKPSGWLVHRGLGRAPVVLVDVVKEITGDARAFPVHRLDRGTSGLVLFARDSDVARALSAQFERGEVRKGYLALVRGEAPEERAIDHPIPRRLGGPRVPARTRVSRRLAVELAPRAVSLVEAWPETGRRHQIRRHLKHIDHPLIGDSTYGKGALNRLFGRRWGLRRLALHAAVLRFTDPGSGQRRTFRSPLPPDLAEPLRAMGFPDDALAPPAFPEQDPG